MLKELTTGPSAELKLANQLSGTTPSVVHPKPTATAAAGSAAQLPHVEVELKQEQGATLPTGLV